MATQTETNAMEAPKNANAVLHPYWVLLAAIVLPGFGHVLCGQARRGLTMQLFMISLGFVTWHLTMPGQSIAGRLAGGIFVYAMSVLEVYRIASLRYAAARSQV
jgi:hypothetical protein